MSWLKWLIEAWKRWWEGPQPEPDPEPDPEPEPPPEPDPEPDPDPDPEPIDGFFSRRRVEIDTRYFYTINAAMTGLAVPQHGRVWFTPDRSTLDLFRVDNSYALRLDNARVTFVTATIGRISNEGPPDHFALTVRLSPDAFRGTRVINLQVNPTTKTATLRLDGTVVGRWIFRGTQRKAIKEVWFCHCDGVELEYGNSWPA